MEGKETPSARQEKPANESLEMTKTVTSKTNMHTKSSQATDRAVGEESQTVWSIRQEQQEDC